MKDRDPSRPAPTLGDGSLSSGDKALRQVTTTKLSGRDPVDGEQVAALGDAADLEGHESGAIALEADPFGFPDPRWIDEGEIAKGGMGSIRMTFDPVFRRHIAMKVIAPHLNEEPRMRRRFLDEAQITGQLDHPNVVPVYEFGRDGSSNLFFTMKLVKGRTLAEEIRSLFDGNPTEDDLVRLVRILLRVCDAVSFAHSNGVVHRDLKPSNIMIGSHGQVYVMDWGVALVLPTSADRPGPSVDLPGAENLPGHMVGTLGYMAPEQALGLTDQTDIRADVYSIGAILYEILTGDPPIVADSVRSNALLIQRALPHPRQSRLWKRLPPTLCQIAMKALEPDPSSRYANLEEMQRDTEAFLVGGDWFETRMFAKGEIITAEGDVGDCAYIIARGSCAVTKTVRSEKILLRTLGPGEVFGETAVFVTRTRTATVTACEEVEVKIVNRESLEFELKRTPWFGAFVRNMATRFWELDRSYSDPPPAPESQ